MLNVGDGTVKALVCFAGGCPEGGANRAHLDRGE